jgi:hypothetical protein
MDLSLLLLEMRWDMRSFASLNVVAVMLEMEMESKSGFVGQSSRPGSSGRDKRPC